MSGFEIIEHTADIGIHVSGKELSELFVNAAVGMVSLIINQKIETKGQKKIKTNISAVDKEQLLVKWLQELLYLFDVKKLVPVDFKIFNISDSSMSAKVETIPLNPKIHVIEHQIKAVTYHNLAIKKVHGQFETTVIFDV